MTGRAVKGESGIGLDCIGYILPEKTGGVALLAKKERCERLPLELLHRTQHAIMLNGS